MNWWAWILVAAAACAPPPAERLRNPKRIPHRDEAPFRRVQIPDLLPSPPVDLGVLTPDFHDELRWPLTPMNHPAMEPKFPIAQVFAQPGIGWLELCKRGVQNRSGGAEKELISYLRGWCKAIDGDVDAACSNLAPLINSTTARLETAVRNDLANILSQEHADKAEHYIRVHSIRDAGLLDLLAANYVEVGTSSDALAINRNAIDSDDYATPATQCLRWTRHIVLTNDKTSLLIKQIEQFAKVPKNPDPTCVREYAKLTCWATRECSAHVHENGGALFDGDILGELEAWQRDKTSTEWWRIVDVVTMQLSTPHASPLLSDQALADIAIAAMYNGVVVSGVCTGSQADVLNSNAKTLLAHASGEYAQHFDMVIKNCP